MSDPASVPFLVRHEFAIRRLHSLLGIVPLGAYMVVHLFTNATLLNGPATFQRMVFQIHGLGLMLPVIEWGFILLPLLFHGILGVWIWRTGKSNALQYPLPRNKAYVWQRWTGLIALVFLLVHVFHLHGWLQFSWWLHYVAEPLGMAKFKPYNAASTLARAMDGIFWPLFYLAGVLACVYHLANGLWTAGITWGIWISPAAQRRARRACLGLGVLMGLLGVGAWWAAIRTDPVAAVEVESKMYSAGVTAGQVIPNEHKRAFIEEPASEEEPAGKADAAEASEALGHP